MNKQGCTVLEILAEVYPLKSMSMPTLYKHLRALKIKPLGVRQSPQRYPNNTAERVLKRLGFTLALLFSLACHAQTQRWELSIPFQATGDGVPSEVYPDGAGGGAVLVHVNNVTGNYTRCVWFNVLGVINATNDLPERISSLNRANTLQVLRVTPKVLDLEARIYDSNDLPTFTLRRFTRGKAGVLEFPLRVTSGIQESERPAAHPAATPDKRGFFTTQQSPTNVIVRRYTY